MFCKTKDGSRIVVEVQRRRKFNKKIEELETLEHRIFKRMFDISALIKMDEVTRSKVLMKMTTERDLIMLK